MAKNKEQPKEQSNEQADTAVAAFKAKDVIAEPYLPKLGEIVIFSKDVSTQSGSQKATYPAMVVGYPKASNFQDKDLAVDIVIFGQPGAMVDQKYGIMFSKEKAHGRWSFRE